tara:strand:+ start:228 stop:521 length:294 start_codon:yes stop_codon:yes gene_type:complete
MTRNLNLPFFPIAPDQYTQTYMAEVVRAFSVYLLQMQNPGEGRHTELVLTNLQTHDRSLEIGGLFQQDGFVKIVRQEAPHPEGLSGATTVGSVTVTT